MGNKTSQSGQDEPDSDLDQENNTNVHTKSNSLSRSSDYGRRPGLIIVKGDLDGNRSEVCAKQSSSNFRRTSIKHRMTKKLGIKTGKEYFKPGLNMIHLNVNLTNWDNECEVPNNVGDKGYSAKPPHSSSMACMPVDKMNSNQAATYSRTLVRNQTYRLGKCSDRSRTFEQGDICDSDSRTSLHAEPIDFLPELIQPGSFPCSPNDISLTDRPSEYLDPRQLIRDISVRVQDGEIDNERSLDPVVTPKVEESDSLEDLLSADMLINMKFLIKQLREEVASWESKNSQLQSRHSTIGLRNSELLNKLRQSRLKGLQLESVNGRYITESLKHKYLQTELRQLTTEYDRRKARLSAKELERVQLHQDREKIQKEKLSFERHHQDVFIESTLASQQLRDLSNKCSNLETYRRNEAALEDTKRQFRSTVGRLGVIILCRPTAHESCLHYISPTEIEIDMPSEPSDQGHAQEPLYDSVKPNCETFRFEHIIHQTACSALETYRMTICILDGVINGISACLITLGPKYAGKSRTLVGELTSHLTNEQRSELHKTMLCLTSSQQTNLLSSEAFATTYGLLGLVLVHFLQSAQLFGPKKCHSDDFDLVERNSQISVSIIKIPLNSKLSEFDVIANRPVHEDNNYEPNSSSSNQNEPNRYVLEQFLVRTLKDVIYICDLVHRHLSHDDKLGQLADQGHRAIVIQLHSPLRHTSSNPGLLLLLDTIGLEPVSLSANGNLEAETARSLNRIRTWQDISTLVQLARLQNTKQLTHPSRLAGLIQHFFPGRMLNKSMFKFLVHLSCDLSDATVSARCLKLASWITKWDKTLAGLNSDPLLQESMTNLLKSEPKCLWKIGLVGYDKQNQSHKSLPLDVSNSSARLRSTSMTTNPRRSTKRPLKFGKLQSELRRNQSVE